MNIDDSMDAPLRQSVRAAVAVRALQVIVEVLIGVKVWCLQLLVNYGIVEDDNPYDKLQLTATIPHSDPLFQVPQ